MKNYIKYLLLFTISMTVISCTEDLESPNVDLAVDISSPQAGQTVTFTITGDADTFVLFTGDTNKEYKNSHLAITEGLDVDQELVVLATDSLPKIRDYITPFVNTYNASAGPAQQYDINQIMTNIETLVGEEYTNKLTAAYELWLFAPEIQGETFRNVVNLYFEDNSTLLAPEGGFSSGVAVNRYEKAYEYSYNTPGMYVVTLVATNLSNKKYSGSGYQDDRTSSGDEYDYKRTYKEITITVLPPAN